MSRAPTERSHRRLDGVPEPPPAAVMTALVGAGVPVRLGESLRRHTSFRVGGPADLFAAVRNVAELQAILRACRAHDYPVFYLGGGTNLLVSDRGVRGAVVKLDKSFDFVEWNTEDDGASLRVGAAVPFKRLVSQTIAATLAGLEFAEGIPGTVGGGLLMNAGAFGGEIGSVVEAIEVVTEAGDAVTIPKDALNFSYRRLALPTRAVVTAIRMRLARGERATLLAKVADAKARRDRHQPRGAPNAGSIFKNPTGEHAGRLLEAAGLKGARLGGAMISERHANFIVNAGGATATDVVELMRFATRVVRDRFGITLDREVRLVGDW